MKGTKLFLSAGLALALLAGGVWHLGGKSDLVGFSQAERFLNEIRQGIRPELAKLLFLMERLVRTDLAVIYDGNTYDTGTAVRYARSYIAKNYRNEKAETWIKNHLYRSAESREVIYLKFPDGRLRPLRDVLLDELRRLPI